MAKVINKQKRKRLGQPRPAPTGLNQTPGLEQVGASPAARGKRNTAPLGTDLRKQQQRKAIAETSASATRGQEVTAFGKTALDPALSQKLQRKLGAIFETDVASPRSLAGKRKFGDRSIILDRIAGRKPLLTGTRGEFEAQDRLFRSVGIDPTTMGALGAEALTPSPEAPAAPILTPKQIEEEFATTPLPRGSTFEAVTDEAGRKIFKLTGKLAEGRAERVRRARIAGIHAPDVSGLITDPGGAEIGRTTFTIEEGREGDRDVFTGRRTTTAGGAEIRDINFEAAKRETLARGVPADETIGATRTRLGIPEGFLEPTIQLKTPEALLRQAGDDPALIERAIKKIERAYITNLGDRARDMTTQKMYMAAKERLWGMDQDLRAVRSGSASLQTAINSLGKATGNEFHGLFETLMEDKEGSAALANHPNAIALFSKFRVETIRLVKEARATKDKKEELRLKGVLAQAKKDGIRASIVNNGKFEADGGVVTTIVRGQRIFQTTKGSITDAMKDKKLWSSLTEEGTEKAADKFIWLGGRGKGSITRKGLRTLVKQYIEDMNQNSIPQSEQGELLGRYIHSDSWSADLRDVLRRHQSLSNTGNALIIRKALDSPPVGLVTQFPGEGGFSPAGTGEAPADGPAPVEPAVEPAIPGTPPPVAPPEPTETGEVGVLEDPTITIPTVLVPKKEAEFREWYAEIAQAGGLSGDPEDIAFYDIRGMFDEGGKLDDNNQLPGEFRMVGWSDPGQPIPPPPVFDPTAKAGTFETEMRAYRQEHGQQHQQQQVTTILRELAKQRAARTGRRSTNGGPVPIEPRAASAGKRAFLSDMLSGRP